MREGDEACRRIAARQQGVLSLAQARRCGFSDDAVQRRVRSGRWQRIHSGVCRLAGAPDCWRQRLRAATLWAGADSAVSHRAAAALWGMDGFEEGLIELSVRRSTRLTGGGCMLHRPLLPLESRDRVRIDGLLVSGAARTLVDLCAVVPIARVEEALESCLRRCWTTEAALRMRLERQGGTGHRGTAGLKALLHLRGSSTLPTESLFETRLQGLIRASRLPLPTRQFEVRDGARFIARVDFAYPRQQIALETDGAAHHLRRVKWEPDHARRNALVARGWSCLVVTWARLCRDPEGIVEDLRAALRARGA